MDLVGVEQALAAGARARVSAGCLHARRLRPRERRAIAAAVRPPPAARRAEVAQAAGPADVNDARRMMPPHLGAVRRFVAAVIAASPARVGISAVLMLASSLTEGIGVLMLVPLLALVGVDGGDGALAHITAAFARAFFAVGIMPRLGSVLLIYVAVVGLQSILHRWQKSLDNAVQYEFACVLRDRVYRAMAGARWTFLARTPSSEALHILTREIERARSATFSLAKLALSAVLALVYLGVAIRVSPAATAVVISAGGLLAWTMRARIDRTQALGRESSASGKQIYSAITEHLASMKTAKSYGAAQRHAEIFGRLSTRERDVNLRSMHALAAARQRLALGATIVLAVVVYVSYGIIEVATGQLLLLLFIFGRLIPRLTGLYEMAQTFAMDLPAFEAIVAFEARCLEAREPDAASDEAIVFGEAVRIDNVTFSYRDDGGAPAVRDIIIDIAAGHTTAIVGPSGAGKSTLVDLLTGLLQPTSGRILVDGHVLRPEHLRAWRQQIGYVPQETFLFHDSVRENLLWARPDATEDDLWCALDSAAAADFVTALPKGLDTLVGDRGILISGGERQRLALARALLRRPTLLILDEATSSLDSENEARIQGALERLRERITIVIVTHRLSTVRRADTIHVIDRGCLVESGGWSGLLGREGGRFRELCRAQGIHDPNESPVEVA
jgi:ATP-binding cassette, subfamily C, bacterial